MAVTAAYDQIDKYIVKARLLTPLHVGAADKGTGEVLVHPVSGLPFVQASGISGVFRASYRDLFTDPLGEASLFGDNDRQAGRIRFTDGIIEGKDGAVKMELRPRIRINPITGTSASARGKGRDGVSGQKFETEYVGAGAEIEFRVYLYTLQSDPSSTSDRERVEKIFARIHGTDPSGQKEDTAGSPAKCREGEPPDIGNASGQVQFGGQKSNGCGTMEILSLRHHAFDMLTAEGRKSWKTEDDEGTAVYEERKSALEEIPDTDPVSLRVYTITLEGETEGALLVKAMAVTGEETKEKEPDYVNMRNALGDYIIPGSSVKGAVRAQFERIAGYLEKNQKCFAKRAVIEDAFGRTGSRNDTGTAGNVRFFDVLIRQIEGREKDITYNRIHIDRFTGGVMHTGLFQEQAVHGRMRIETAVMNHVRHADTGPIINAAEAKLSALQKNTALNKEEKASREQDLSAERDSLIFEAERAVIEEARIRADRSCGMMILALRDLAAGMYSLGSGYSVGRGFIRARKMTIRRADGKKAELTFSQKTDGSGQIKMDLQDPDKIVEACLKALREAGPVLTSEEA